MAKHHKGNKTPAAQHTNTAQSAVASAWQKATTGIGAIASLVQSDASVVTLWAAIALTLPSRPDGEIVMTC
jgi:hypothetical protein